MISKQRWLDFNGTKVKLTQYNKLVSPVWIFWMPGRTGRYSRKKITLTAAAAYLLAVVNIAQQCRTRPRAPEVDMVGRRKAILLVLDWREVTWGGEDGQQRRIMIHSSPEFFHLLLIIVLVGDVDQRRFRKRGHEIDATCRWDYVKALPWVLYHWEVAGEGMMVGSGDNGAGTATTTNYDL